MSEVAENPNPMTSLAGAPPIGIIAHPEPAKDEPVSVKEVEVDEFEAPPKGVGVLFMMFTLLGTRLGAGIVGVPLATHKLGYVFALIMQICFVPIGMFSANLLLSSRNLTGRSSLSDLGFFCYGTPSIYVINCLIALAQLGYPIIFFIVWGDAMGGLIDKVNSGTFWSSRLFTQGLLGILLIVLAIQKDISKIKIAGMVVLACVAIFMLLFFIHCMISDPDPEPEADHLETSLTWKFFSALPTFITIYTFQTSFFTAFAALKNKTKKNGQLADGGGRIVAFFTYTVSPLIAMALYGKNIKSNLLLNIAKDEGAIPIILMFLFMIIAFLTIPIIFFVGKEAILIIFDEITRGTYSGRYLKKKKAQDQMEPESPAPAIVRSEGDEDSDPRQQNPDEEDVSARGSHQPVATTNEMVAEDKPVEEEEEFIPNPKEYLTMRPLYYYLVLFIAWFIIIVLSIVVGDVSVFFGIIGSISANFCMFMGPGSFYIIIHHKKKLGFPTTWSKIKYGLAWVYLVTGITLAISLCMCVIVYAVNH